MTKPVLPPRMLCKIFLSANKHKDLMDAHLEFINRHLRDLLDDHNASMFYQASDGWVILWGKDQNSAVQLMDLHALFSATKEEAIEMLQQASV